MRAIGASLISTTSKRWRSCGKMANSAASAMRALVELAVDVMKASVWVPGCTLSAIATESSIDVASVTPVALFSQRAVSGGKSL